MKRRRIYGLKALDSLRDIAREANVLSSSVTDEAPKFVKDVLQDPDISASASTEYQLLMDKLVRGNASLLENIEDPEVRELVAKLRMRANQADKMAEAYEKDREHFVEEVFNRADKIAPPGDISSALIAVKGSKEFQNKVQSARAKVAMDNARIQYRIQNDPKELIDVPAREEHGEKKPYVIRIANVRYSLKTGQQLVPQIIASRYRDMRRAEELHDKRKSVLLKYPSYHQAQTEFSVLGR